MRLTIDLRFSAPPQPSSAEDVVASFRELVPLAGRPRQLAGLLRGQRYGVVRVLEDAGPMSGVQASCLLMAAVARTRRFEVAGGDVVARGRVSFAISAIRRFAVASCTEVVSSVASYVRALAASRRRTSLPVPAPFVRRVTYLRVEPSLRWLGQQVGGATSHTAGVINGFADHGVEVDVYASERPSGVRSASFTQVVPRRLLLVVQWLTLTALVREFLRAAAAQHTDIVYQRYALGSYAGLALAGRTRTPLVLEFNGSELWTARHWWDSPVTFEATLQKLERRQLLDATLVVVPSEVVRDDLVADGIDPAKVLVNPNGVDVEGLAPVRELDAPGWRARLGRAEAPTVGFIGTFGMWHGVTVLPEMIERVAAARPDVRWVLIGDGPLHAQVAHDIAARGLTGVVELTGVVPHEHAVELLASCEVCVSPHVPNPDGTRFFGSPTKLFEYMGLGKAIVASDLEQIGEVLDHERSALLCEPGDGAAAANGVLRLLDDPDLAARLGEAALADAAERYSWTAHTRRILDALTALSAR